MFAGIVVSAADGKQVSLPQAKDSRIFHLSQLSLVPGHGSSSYTRIFIHRAKQSFAIACLQPGKVESVCVDMMFDLILDEIKFSAKGGNAVVHMCGYFEPPVDEEDEDDDDSDGESMVSISDVPEEYKALMSAEHKKVTLQHFPFTDEEEDVEMVSCDRKKIVDIEEQPSSCEDDEIDFEGLGDSDEEEEVGGKEKFFDVDDIASTEDEEEEEEDTENMINSMAEEGSESEEENIDENDTFGQSEYAAIAGHRAVCTATGKTPLMKRRVGK
eukprot:GHVS01060489.1.p1 GENE.GHVS01060489.1~~GHVS01060489.1.p1  ORF type:complete len:271 (-),score=67.97 GHVS01060489.1:183-995(-)